MSTEEWMPLLDLRLAPDEFRRLPRHAAYRYSYHEGVVWMSPCPRFYHAALDLQGPTGPTAAPVTVRPFHADDWDAAVSVFANAFAQQQPFAGLSPEARALVARECLERVQAGGDGPWIEAASFAAVSRDGELVGALLVTLVPNADPTDWAAYVWLDPPPTDALARRLGRPHLTWIFVHSREAGQGIGTALLNACVVALRALGFTELHTTMMVGNESSMLWHWRSGFRLLAYPGSRRS
ncbi:MAG: GNAT family N-acetyltransferase [Gemmataceae bacterium]